MDEAGFRDWLERYFAAWRSNDRAEVEALFSEDAVYYVSPFQEPRRGRDEIVDVWISGGVQPELRLEHRPLAFSGATGVAHWAASFVTEDGGARVDLDGLILLEFDQDGRCRDHREWFAERIVEAG